MKWLGEHKTFTAIAAILLALLVFLVGSYKLKDTGGPVGKFTNTVISLVQKPVASVSNILGNGLNGMFSDDALEAENAALKEQVSELQTKLTKEQLDREELNELEQLSKSLNTDSLRNEYELIAANVLSYDKSNAFTIFTIDKGTESGFLVNSPVVNGDGLIGRILETKKGWSKVVSIIDETNNVGFQLYDNLNYLGVVHGDGNGNLTGELLDEEAVVEDGNRIITSGIGGIYPAGLVIGEVTGHKLTKENDLISVKVKPAVYFKGLKKVAVLV
jgi:rod shape-determining protein MreC